MTGDWLASFEALKSVYIDEAFSNIAINEAVERHKECSSGFVRNFTKGVIRDTIKLDYIISKLADNGLKGIKKRTLIVIRMGIYAIDNLDSVPDYAAVNQCVNLSKLVSKGNDRFVNALLRRYIRDGLVVPDDIGIKYSFPTELVCLLQQQYGTETEKILKALNTAPLLSIRCNLLKNDREDLINQLAVKGIRAEADKGSCSAILISEGKITSTEQFRNGDFTIQGISSIRAIEAFAPKEGAKVLDMCAAPGGKTTAMAEIMKDKGSITACDIYPHRLELVEASAKRLGISIIDTRELDGTIFDENLAEEFDYVLCDVPCSGLGVICSKPEIKYRANITNLDTLQDIQLKILENAYMYTRKGGKIMYSTCTVNRHENDEVIDCFMKKNVFAKIVEKCLFLPYNNLMGFYYCIIEK